MIEDRRVGALGHGKSSLLDAIDFMLIGQTLPRRTSESVEYDRAYVTIEARYGICHELTRASPGGDCRILELGEGDAASEVDNRCR